MYKEKLKKIVEEKLNKIKNWFTVKKLIKSFIVLIILGVIFTNPIVNRLISVQLGFSVVQTQLYNWDHPTTVEGKEQLRRVNLGNDLMDSGEILVNENNRVEVKCVGRIMNLKEPIAHKNSDAIKQFTHEFKTCIKSQVFFHNWISAIKKDKYKINNKYFDNLNIKRRKLCFKRMLKKEDDGENYLYDKEKLSDKTYFATTDEKAATDFLNLYSSLMNCTDK